MTPADFAFRSITAEDVFEHFLSAFPALRDAGVTEKEGFEFEKTWLLQPGFPPFVPDLSAGRELAAPAEEEAAKWLTLSAAEAKGAGTRELALWSTYKKLHFLDTLVEASPLSDAGAVPGLDAQYDFSTSSNAEVRR